MLSAAVDFGTMMHANLFTNIKVARIANCLNTTSRYTF